MSKGPNKAIEDACAERLAHKKEVKKRAKERKADPNAIVGRGTKLPVMTRVEQQRKLHELKSRFLESKKLPSLINKVFEIAMDDKHDDQFQAIKLVMDKVLPAQGFSQESKRGSAPVQINITGLQVETKEKETNREVSIQ
jgi:hypothetical protein